MACHSMLLLFFAKLFYNLLQLTGDLNDKTGDKRMMTGLNWSGVEIGLDVDWGILLRDLFRIVRSMAEVFGVKGSQNTKK